MTGTGANKHNRVYRYFDPYAVEAGHVDGTRSFSRQGKKINSSEMYSLLFCGERGKCDSYTALETHSIGLVNSFLSL